MKDRGKRLNPIQAILKLQHNEEAKRKTVQPAVLDPRMAMLRRWQSERLAHTYADFLQDECCAAACRFFLSDVYAARDFSQRDQDFAHLHELLSRFLPATMLQLLSNSIELNQLTYDLDHRLLDVLVTRLGVTDSLTVPVYTEGYRLCDNYAERAEQIDRLAAILHEVGEGARLPFVGVSLKLARGPAQRAGWIELYDFLERGYKAFRELGGKDTFPSAVLQREKRILDRIYSGDPDPFTF